MVRISNIILTILNAITLVLGLSAMGLGLYYMLGPTSSVTACEKGVHIPILLTGAVLSVVSLLGLVGSCCRVNLVLFLYLTVMFLLIVGLIGFTIFAFLVTNGNIGKLTSKTKVTDFQGRLWGHLIGGENWEDITKCLADTKICKSLGGAGNDGIDHKLTEFYQKNLSPLQSGCCKPPTSCGFLSQNATFWVAPKRGLASNDTDCTTWSNQQKTLCYNCESCKAGFVANVKDKWKLILIVNICAIILCIIVYTIGCCAKTNNRKDRNKKRFRGYQYHP